MKYRKLTKQLLDKAIESFLLSIELYNKPTINYRIESFAILSTNAWELLLKARLYEESHGRKLSIFRPKVKNQKRESITLDDCLKSIFPEDNNPIRKNIEFVSELRNESTHLVIAEFNPYYSRVFQSGVINFLNKTSEWFQIESANFLPAGLLALITGEQFPDLERIRKNYNKEDYASLTNWVQNYEKLQELGNEAALSIKHTVAIVKDPNKADYIVSIGEKGDTAIKVVKALTNIDDTHPYPTKDLVAKVNEILNGSIVITDYTLQAYAYIRGVKQNNNQYHAKSKLGPHQYSEQFAQEMVSAIRENNLNIEGWRKRYSKHLRNRRHS